MRGIVDEPELMLVMEYLPPGALSSYLKMYWDKLNTHRLLKFAKDVAKVCAAAVCRELSSGRVLTRTLRVAGKVECFDFVVIPPHW